MRLLLDTNTLLWWVVEGGSGVTATASTAISSPDNDVFVSVASAWEIAIKTAKGRLDLPEVAGTYVPRLIDSFGFLVLPIELGHALRAGSLPRLHRDPFDRLLVAQSQIEDMPLVTSDPEIRRYDVETIW